MGKPGFDPFGGFCASGFGEVKCLIFLKVRFFWLSFFFVERRTSGLTGALVQKNGLEKVSGRFFSFEEGKMTSRLKH